MKSYQQELHEAVNAVVIQTAMQVVACIDSDLLVFGVLPLTMPHPDTTHLVDRIRRVRDELKFLRAQQPKPTAPTKRRSSRPSPRSTRGRKGGANG